MKSQRSFRWLKPWCSLANWLHGQKSSKRRRLPLQLEVLEIRMVPTMVTSLADDLSAGTLREAVLNTPSGGTVTFQSGLTGTITLLGTSGGAIAINKNLTITGPGAGSVSVSGNNALQIFTVASGDTRHRQRRHAHAQQLLDHGQPDGERR
jgi:hypothetical protein